MKRLATSLLLSAASANHVMYTGDCVSNGNCVCTTNYGVDGCRHCDELASARWRVVSIAADSTLRSSAKSRCCHAGVTTRGRAAHAD